MWCTSDSVARSWGPVVGITVARPAAPDGLETGSPTEATPLVWWSSSRRCWKPAAWGAVLVSATTTTGPFEPGPKPSAMRS